MPAKGARKLTSRGGKRKPDAAAVEKARADAEAADPGGFGAAETFGGARAGFSFRTGPLGTGYYRDAAAPATPVDATFASPPKPPAERSASRESSPAMRSRTVRASSSPPEVAAAADDTERIGDQGFSMMDTFADNYESDLLGPEPPAQAGDSAGSSSGQDDAGGGGGAPGGLFQQLGGGFDEAESHASFLEALGDWRKGGPEPEPQAEVWSHPENDTPDPVPLRGPPQRLPTQQLEPPPVARCTTPIECQTDSRPLARPSTAGAKRPGSAGVRPGSAGRKSYFEDLIAAKAALASPKKNCAAERRTELAALRAARARQAEELAEMRARNAALKATLEKENDSPDLKKQAEEANRFVRECHSPRPGPGAGSTGGSVSPPEVKSLAAPLSSAAVKQSREDESRADEEAQQPLALPSPAMVALGMVGETGSRPHTPAEIESAKSVAREFTDMLFRPMSAPSVSSPARGGGPSGPL